jgi:ATP-dependent exoDNAse (exonuclease V) beta subunit
MKNPPSHLNPLLEYKAPEINWDTDKIISYSQYSTWKQCPHKWKLQNVDKLKNPPNINLIFGTAMHSTIQHFLTVMYDKGGLAADSEDLVALFEQNLKTEYKNGYEKNKNVHFSNPDELNEFYEDGKAILEFFQNRRMQYFSTAKTHLVGIEFPLSYSPHEHYPFVKYKGFIDVIMYNEETDVLYIYDIKTSTRGWADKDKKDDAKSSQILLYKEYVSKIFNWDVNKIEVEFFIVKRKIPKKSDFPISRIQRYSPVSGPRKRSAAISSLRKFIEDCFDTNAKPLEKEFEKKVSSLCKWCSFNNTSLCIK